jgi:hypothetical protein
MEAQQYPPASTYLEPAAVDYTLSVSEASVLELLAIPLAREAILTEIPDFEKRVSGDIGQHLGNLSLKLLADYTVIDKPAFERIATRVDAMRLSVSDTYRQRAKR